MKKTSISKMFHTAAVAVIALVMILLPASRSAAAQPLLIPANVGYVGPGYDTVNVKDEPTADNPESKVWFNDGFWWSVMFDNTTSKYFIYRLNPANQLWVKTATELDSRKDTDSTTVDTRFDALWDGTKLYLASHIQLENPAVTSNLDNRGRVYRYSYSGGTYTLDTGFPALNVGRAKTASMVLDKDSSERLWVTYVARVPTQDPLDDEPYRVWVNYTTTAGNDTAWGTPKSLHDFSAVGATVSENDISSVITYGSKVGVMWSNQIDGNFYFAEIDAGDDPQTAANWAINPILPDHPTLTADDHIKLVANNQGQVFAAVKTAAPANTNALLSREANGTFHFDVYTNSDGNNDTHPTLAYNATTNTIYMFTVSTVSGGVVCVKSSAVNTANLATIAFDTKPCDPDDPNSAQHFIANQTHVNVNNPTTTKRPFTTASGLVVLATDVVDLVYLHNMLGGGVVVPPSTEKIYLPFVRK